MTRIRREGWWGTSGWTTTPPLTASVGRELARKLREDEMKLDDQTG